jgi:hypothetical protein
MKSLYIGFLIKKYINLLELIFFIEMLKKYELFFNQKN